MGLFQILMLVLRFAHLFGQLPNLLLHNVSRFKLRLLLVDNILHGHLHVQLVKFLLQFLDFLQQCFLFVGILNAVFINKIFTLFLL